MRIPAAHDARYVSGEAMLCDMAEPMNSNNKRTQGLLGVPCRQRR